MLYQNDSFGKDYLIGLKDGLGADHAGMVIKEVSYETSEPTVDSQIVTLQGAGVDTVLYAATPKFAAQAIRKTYDIGWTPVRYMTDVSQSIATVMKPAGLEKSKGVITAVYGKDPTDARWKDDPGLQGVRGVRRQIHDAEGSDGRERGLRIWRRGHDGAGAQAVRQRPVARERHATGGQPQGSDVADGSAGHQDQHLARPISARSARMQLATLRRRELGAVRRPDDQA